MADTVDVNPSTGHVRGHQHANLAFTKTFERLDALVLWHVTRQLGGVDAITHQALFDAAYFVLAVGEHDHPFPTVVIDQVEQQLVLVGTGNGIDVLLDHVAGDVDRFDLDDGRVGGPLLGQVHHILGKGRGEQQRLAFGLWRCLTNDLTYLRDKTHVQHAVGFVEHHHFDHVQMHFAALVEVQQAARCGHQDVAMPGFQLLELLVEVHAAHERHDVEVGVLGQVGCVLGNLHHQFTGRGDDQRTRFAHVTLFGRWGLGQLADDRYQERSGFARAGLGAANGVTTAQGVAQHTRLDRCAVREPQVLDGVH